MGDNYPMDKLIAKLSEQQSIFAQQNMGYGHVDNASASGSQGPGSSANSLPITPATEGFTSTAPTTRPASAFFANKQQEEESELLRLKVQLSQAQNHISKLDTELAHSRASVKPEFDSVAMGPGGTYRGRAPIPAPIWTGNDNSQPGMIENTAFPPPARNRNIWGAQKGNIAHTSVQAPIPEASPNPWTSGRSAFNQGYMTPGPAFHPSDPPQSERLSPQMELLIREEARRANGFPSRMSSPQHYPGTYEGYSPVDSQYNMMMGPPVPGAGPMQAPMGNSQALVPLSMGMYAPDQQHLGTQLSPYASEFTSRTPWKTEVCHPGKMIDANMGC